MIGAAKKHRPWHLLPTLRRAIGPCAKSGVLRHINCAQFAALVVSQPVAAQWSIDAAQIAPVAHIPRPGAVLSPADAWVTAAAFSANGSILVASGADGTLSRFDATGAHRGTVFLGEHPSDVGVFPMWIGRCGTDGSLVYDFGTKTVIELDSTLRVLLRRQVTERVGHELPGSLTCLTRERFAALTRPSIDDMASAIDDGSGFVHFRTQLEVLGPRLNTESSVTLTSGEYALTQRGSIVYSATGPQIRVATLPHEILISDGKSGRVLIYSDSGRLRDSIRTAFTAHRHDSTSREAAFRRATEFSRDTSARSRILRTLRSLPRREYQPLIQGLMADERKMIWVEGVLPAANGRPGALVYSLRGKLLGQVLFPPDARLVSVSTTHFALRRYVGGREFVDVYPR